MRSHQNFCQQRNRKILNYLKHLTSFQRQNHTNVISSKKYQKRCPLDKSE